MEQGIYFPNRSNLSFFEEKGAQPPLVSRIKQSILMYDTLVFDGGEYSHSCSEAGAFETNFPSNILSKEYSKVPEKPYQGFQVDILNEQTGKGGSLIPYANKANSYAVSFQRVLRELEIDNEKFVKIVDKELSPKGKEELNRRMQATESYKEYLPGGTFHKEYILKNFHTSILMADHICLPMMVDGLHKELLKRISSDLYIRDERLKVLERTLIYFKMPEFSSQDIDTLLALRKDKTFVNFRKKLLEINQRVGTTSENGGRLDLEMERLNSELIAEMNEFKPSKKDILVSGVIGAVSLIPGLGAISSGLGIAKDVGQYWDYQTRWSAFVMEYAGKGQR